MVVLALHPHNGSAKCRSLCATSPFPSAAPPPARWSVSAGVERRAKVYVRWPCIRIFHCRLTRRLFPSNDGYWAVDFDYESRKEIIKREKNFGIENSLPGTAVSTEFVDFEEHWTGAYIFENEWQSFRTRQSRDLELTTISHTYPRPGRFVIAVKVIDIFGNDTMTLVPVSVG
jgi:hypothetical protein